MFHIRYLGNVGLRGQADHDVQFLQFHIDRVVVLDKEHFDLLLQDLGPAHEQHKTYQTVDRQDPGVTEEVGCDCFQEGENIVLSLARICDNGFCVKITSEKEEVVFYLRTRH